MPTCHYEILGVPQDADDSQIKKAHRKLALKYHPDKNQGNEEAAAEQFRLVQAAYDCLSDAHERQWYDDHREAILRGYKIGEVDSEDEDQKIEELYMFMTSFAFDGFDEVKSPNKNFFKVYRDLFIKIDMDEPPHTESDGPMPNFGKSTTEWEDVDLFYGYWEGFATRKTYGYLDKYDTRTAPDRRVKRLMEQENKKVRDKAKKKLNDIVREMVKFVRRRDPRVAKRKEELEIQQKEKAERQEQKRRERLEAQMEAAIAYEEKMMEDENHLRELEELAALEAQIEAEEEEEEEKGKRRKGKKGKKKKKKWSSDEEEVVVVEEPEVVEETAGAEEAVAETEGKNQSEEQEPEPVVKSEPEIVESAFTSGIKKKKKKKNKPAFEEPEELPDLDILKVSDSGDDEMQTKSKKKKKRGKKR